MHCFTKYPPNLVVKKGDFPYRSTTRNQPISVFEKGKTVTGLQPPATPRNLSSTPTGRYFGSEAASGREGQKSQRKNVEIFGSRKIKQQKMLRQIIWTKPPCFFLVYMLIFCCSGYMPKGEPWQNPRPQQGEHITSTTCRSPKCSRPKRRFRRLTSKVATKQTMSNKSTHMIFVVKGKMSMKWVWCICTFGCCLNTIARSCTNTSCLWDTPSIPASFVAKNQSGNVRPIKMSWQFASKPGHAWMCGAERIQTKIQAKLHLSRGRSEKARTRKILKSVFKPKLREIRKLRFQTTSMFQFWIDSN